jgi:hypothetical protein
MEYRSTTNLFFCSLVLLELQPKFLKSLLEKLVVVFIFFFQIKHA